MKKALIVTALAGFIRSFLQNDILILQNMGYEVHCAANMHHIGSENISFFFTKLNVKFHQIEFSSNKPVSKESIVAYKQMEVLINQIDFNIIHCHTPIAGAITRSSCRRQRRRGCKVIYTTHGFYFHKQSSKKTWLVYRTIEDLMSRYSDAIITINHEDYENAKKMHCKKVFYIPGVGVETKRFMNVDINRNLYRSQLGIKDEDFLILAIGELSQRKNHQIIIKALSEAKIKNAVFMICGNALTSENTKCELQKLAQELNVDLRLMGKRDDIPQICKCADVGVMPSTREGLGLSGIEMIASGLPVVASNVHGIVDYIVDGQDGYLCNPYNEHEFACSLKKMTSLELRNSMKNKCTEYAIKFDVKYAEQKMRNIYRELLI